MMQRVQGVRRALVPDIDRKHDEMFASLESLLDTTIKELADTGAPVPPHHLKTLATTLAACQAGRRTVHNKEQSVSKRVVELQTNPEVYESFVQSLVGMTSPNGSQRSGQTHHLTSTIMDAEFEEIEDAPDGGNEEES